MKIKEARKLIGKKIIGKLHLKSLVKNKELWERLDELNLK